MDLPLLGEMLRMRREDLGITRAALGRRIGASANYLWMIEEARERDNGTPSRPSQDLLAKWFEVLEISHLYRYYFMRYAGYQVEGAPDIPVPDREGLLRETAAHLAKKEAEEGVTIYGMRPPRYDALYAIRETRDRLIAEGKLGEMAYVTSLEYGYMKDLPLRAQMRRSHGPETLAWLATCVDPAVPPGTRPDPPYARIQSIINAMDGRLLDDVFL